MDRLTPIAALIERWNIANAANEAAQERHFRADLKTEDGQTEEIRAREAEQRAAAEADAIELAILYQIPETPRDALHLMMHLQCLIECNSENSRNLDARDAAMDALIVWLDDNDLDSTPIEGWHAPGPGYARTRVNERRAVPEQKQ